MPIPFNSKSFQLFKKFPFLAIFICFWGLTNSCTKTFDNNPVIPSLANGNLYFSTSDSIACFSFNDNRILWKAKGYNTGGSAQTSLYYDSGLLYRANNDGITCYNSLDGSKVWTYYVFHASCSGCGNSFDYPIVFKDSLLFFSTHANLAQDAELYCLNKKNGIMKWKQSHLIYGGAAIGSIPVLTGENVLILGGNTGNKLECFNCLDGHLAWETPNNSDLQMNFKYSEGKVYSTGKKTFCYDANNGNLLWSVDMPPLDQNISYIENDKLIIVKPALFSTSGPYYYYVTVLNKNSGAMVSDFSFTEENRVQFGFRNNTLFFTSYDTAYAVKAYDVLSGNLKWVYKTRNINGRFTRHGPPVVTSDQIIFTESVDFGNNQYKLNFTVIDLNGNFTTEIPINGVDYLSLLERFVFLHDNVPNTVHEM